MNDYAVVVGIAHYPKLSGDGIVAVKLLVSVGEPLFDVATEAFDGAGAKDEEAGAFEHLLLRRAHVIPPLQSIQLVAALIRQRDREASSVSRRRGLREREVVFECARQVDVRHSSLLFTPGVRRS